MSVMANDRSDVLPLLAALRRDVGGAWDSEYANSVTDLVRKLDDPKVRRCSIKGPYGLGLPTCDDYPSPGERLADGPLWLESLVGIVNPQLEPGSGVRGGILFEETRDPWHPGLTAASLCFIFKDMAVRVPGRVLIDRDAFDNGGTGFADVIRARNGLVTAADCTKHQLLEMDRHVAYLEDRYWVRVLKDAPGAIAVRGNFDLCQTTPEFGSDGLRATLACTVADVSGRELTDAVAISTRDRASKLANFNVSRGAFFALRALRLAAIPSACHTV